MQGKGLGKGQAKGLGKGQRDGGRDKGVGEGAMHFGGLSGNQPASLQPSVPSQSER